VFLDFLPTGQVSNNLNLLEVFFLVNPFYSLKYTGSSFDLTASIITLFYEYAKKILKYSSIELELGFAILYI